MSAFVSDETLHAFVDGELDVAERERLTVRMQSDPELARRVGAVRALRDMVKLAYDAPPAPPSRATSASARRAFAQRCALGCLVLFAGLAVGWVLRGLDTPERLTQAPVMRDDALQAVSLARVPDPGRVLLHLDNGAPEKMRLVLDEAERLLDEAEREIGRAHV
jgi:anti-sigma factor RsiW